MTPLDVLVGLVLAVVVRAVFHAQIELGASLGFDQPSRVWCFILLALTSPFGMLIHEFGHYAAGAALKQYCRRFVVGPVEFARSAGRWTVRLTSLRHAGLVDLVPSTFARFRLQRAICAAGGPLASLVTGLIFASLSRRAETAWLFWIWSFSAQWALIGLLNLIPIRVGTARSDGYLLSEVIHGGTAVDAIQREFLTLSSQATPLRLRDWPHDLICRLVENTADPVAQRFNFYLAYVHSLDRGDMKAAAQYLDRLMADWTLADPAQYALEAAYFRAADGGDIASAQQWLALETREAEPWVRLRARAAVERAASNPAKARALIDEALAALGAAPACGARQYEIDRLLAVSQVSSREPDRGSADSEMMPIRHIASGDPLFQTGAGLTADF